MQDPQYGNENVNVAEQGSDIIAEKVLSDLFHSWAAWSDLTLFTRVGFHPDVWQSTSVHPLRHVVKL